MANKKTEEQKEFARVLYMNGDAQNVIAEKVGVAKQTVSRWVTAESWNEMRAANNISRPELVNKTLRAVNKFLDKAMTDDKDVDGLGDKLSKMATLIEKLDKSTNPVNLMDNFREFGAWMQVRSQSDPTITPDFLIQLNKHQNEFVTYKLTTERTTK